MTVFMAQQFSGSNRVGGICYGGARSDFFGKFRDEWPTEWL